MLGGWGVEVDAANAGDEGDDLDAVGEAQVLLGDGAGGDTADGLQALLLLPPDEALTLYFSRYV